MKLTLSRAKTLVSRELGIPAAKLARDLTMGNNEFPWFRLTLGNFQVEVYLPCNMAGIVVLNLRDCDGAGSVQKFFRMDSELTFADKTTDWERRIATVEAARNLSPHTLRQLLDEMEPGGEWHKGE